MDKFGVPKEKDRIEKIMKEVFLSSEEELNTHSFIQLQIYKWLKGHISSFQTENFEYKMIPSLFQILPDAIQLTLSIFLLITSASKIWIVYLVALVLLFSFLITPEIVLSLNQKIFKNNQTSHKIKGRNFQVAFNSQKKVEFDLHLVKILIVSHYDVNPVKYRSENTKIWSTILNYYIFWILFHIFFAFIVNFLNSNRLEEINWIILPIEIGILLLLQVILLIFQFTQNPLSYFDNGLRNTVLLHLLERIQENKQKFTWADCDIVLLDGEEFAHQGIKTYIQAHSETLAAYRDIYVVYLDSALGPLNIRRIDSQFSKDLLNKKILVDLTQHFFLRRNLPLLRVESPNPMFKQLNLSQSVQITNKNHNYRWLPTKINQSLTYEQAQKLTEVLYEIIVSLEKSIDETFQEF